MPVIFTLLLSSVSLLKLLLEVRQNFAQRTNHIVNVSVGHAVKHWQTDQTFVCSLGYGILPALVAKTIPVIRMKVNRNVMDVHADIFRAQGPEHVATVRAEPGEIQAYGIKMPGGISVRASPRRQHTRHIAKLVGISGRDLSASRQIPFQLFHLFQAKGASNIG